MIFFLMIRRPPRSTLFPSTTLVRSSKGETPAMPRYAFEQFSAVQNYSDLTFSPDGTTVAYVTNVSGQLNVWRQPVETADRKSTRLNSSHANISYAAFCLKKNTFCGD